MVDLKDNLVKGLRERVEEETMNAAEQKQVAESLRTQLEDCKKRLLEEIKLRDSFKNDAGFGRLMREALAPVIQYLIDEKLDQAVSTMKDDFGPIVEDRIEEYFRTDEGIQILADFLEDTVVEVEATANLVYR